MIRVRVSIVLSFFKAGGVVSSVEYVRYVGVGVSTVPSLAK